MKRTLLCLCLILLGFFCLAQPRLKLENQDTIVIENTIDQWVDSLNIRKLIEDAETLKEDVKELGIKTKKSIERHNPKIKKLFKEIGDYLKR